MIVIELCLRYVPHFVIKQVYSFCDQDQHLIILSVSGWIFYENRRRDRRAAANPDEQYYSSDLLDLTDREHPGIRYIW